MRANPMPGKISFRRYLFAGISSWHKVCCILSLPSVKEYCNYAKADKYMIDLFQVYSKYGVDLRITKRMHIMYKLQYIYIIYTIISLVGCKKGDVPIAQPASPTEHRRQLGAEPEIPVPRVSPTPGNGQGRKGDEPLVKPTPSPGIPNDNRGDVGLNEVKRIENALCRKAGPLSEEKLLELDDEFIESYLQLLERSALANISQSNDDRAQMKWANNLWGKTCPDLKKGMALKGRIINGREVNFLVGEVSDYFDSLSMGGYLDSKVGHKARENFMMTPLFSPLTYYMGLDRKKVVQDLKAEVSGVVDVESHLLVDKTRIHPYRVFEEAKLVLVHPFSIAKEGNRILERKMSEWTSANSSREGSRCSIQIINFAEELVVLGRNLEGDKFATDLYFAQLDGQASRRSILGHYVRFHMGLQAVLEQIDELNRLKRGIGQLQTGCNQTAIRMVDQWFQKYVSKFQSIAQSMWTANGQVQTFIQSKCIRHSQCESSPTELSNFAINYNKAMQNIQSSARVVNEEFGNSILRDLCEGSPLVIKLIPKLSPISLGGGACE